MGNEQSAESSPAGQPGTRSPSPSRERSTSPSLEQPSVSSASSSNPSPPFSPSKQQQKQRRTSTRKKFWSLCPCRHTTHESQQACETDPHSTLYTCVFIPLTEHPSSSSSEESPTSDDSELELPFKCTIKRESGIEDSQYAKLEGKVKTEHESKVRMPEKRAPSEKMKGGRSLRAKKSKTEREKEEQGCDCTEGHQSLSDCEKEGKRVWEDVRTAIIVSSQGMVVVHVGGEGGSLKQRFMVHRELLMLHSSFFREMLKEGFKVEVKEDEETKVKSEEIESPEQEQEMAMISEIVRSSTHTTKNLGAQHNEEWELGLMTHENGQMVKGGEQRRSGDKSRDNSPLSEVPNPYEASDNPFLNMLKKGTPQPVLPILLPTSGTTSTLPLTKITSPLPSFREINVPDLNAIHFTAFLSFIYTRTISPSISDLQLHPTHNFPILYLSASQLGSPGFMNYIMTQQRRKGDRQWPSVEQVRFIHSAVSSYTPLNHPGLNGTMGTGAMEGPVILRKFTAACIAATNPFTRYSEGSDELAEWTKLFGECQGLWLDVLKEGGRWAESKPFEECWRKEWIVEERGLRERWERWQEMFVHGEGR